MLDIRNTAFTHFFINSSSSWNKGWLPSVIETLELPKSSGLLNKKRYFLLLNVYYIEGQNLSEPTISDIYYWNSRSYRK
jgi:hypothetical protein